MAEIPFGAFYPRPPLKGRAKAAFWAYFSCKIVMVRAAGLEPARAMPDGFSYQLRLSPPRDTLELGTRVCGLDYPFTLLRLAEG